MIIIPDWNDKEQKTGNCAEASHNFAYKSMQGIVVGMKKGYDTIVGRQLTVADCKYGYIAAPSGYDQKKKDKNWRKHIPLKAKSIQIKAFGKTPIPACPQNGAGGKCFNIVKRGITIPTIYEESTKFPPKKFEEAHAQIQDRDGAFGGHFVFKQCHLEDFPYDPTVTR